MKEIEFWLLTPLLWRRTLLASLSLTLQFFIFCFCSFPPQSETYLHPVPVEVLLRVESDNNCSEKLFLCMLFICLFWWGWEMEGGRRWLTHTARPIKQTKTILKIDSPTATRSACVGQTLKTFPRISTQTLLCTRASVPHSPIASRLFFPDAILEFRSLFLSLTFLYLFIFFSFFFLLLKFVYFGGRYVWYYVVWYIWLAVCFMPRMSWKGEGINVFVYHMKPAVLNYWTELGPWPILSD